MFGRHESRRHKAERITGQAWENLVSAVGSAGSSTRSAGRRAAALIDGTSNRVESGAKEARRRAGAAFDALAGRRPARPWGLLAAVSLGGLALGWVAALLGRRVTPRKDTVTLPDSLAGDHHVGSDAGDGRQRTEPQQTEPQPTEPQPTEPQQTEPQQTEPQRI
jgi:hypothetical protein